MNDHDFKKLPRYIEASGAGMWGPMPDGFDIANQDAIFVKLKDVEALVSSAVTLREKIVVVHRGVEYVSVGMGSLQLVSAAVLHGWNLHALTDGKMTAGWTGGTPSWEYYIEKNQYHAKK